MRYSVLDNMGKRLGLFAVALGSLFAGSMAAAEDTRQASAVKSDELWRQGVQLVEKGEFKLARDTMQRIPAGRQLTDQVRAWLEEYEAKQAERREIDRADYEKYVGYAKARIERKEYDKALGWALAAADCIEDRETLLSSDWMTELVELSIKAAQETREKQEWRDAWGYYARLGDLFEREPKYKKMEHEVLTHLRLDALFKDDNDWKERIDRVRWADAERAMEYVDHYYVEPPDFKAMTESALEQLLLLAESKTAKERFEGLQDDVARQEFEVRVQAILDRVRGMTRLDRSGAVKHFRRVVRDINEETVRFPEELVVSELMRGALDPLDEFTTVFWPQESDEFDKHTRGDFIGVGISIIQNRAEEIEVVSPMDGGPAFRAGIQAGDIITLVDGESLEGFSLNKVVDTITGPKGTAVTLTIKRGDQTLEFPLMREKIKIFSVKGTKRDEVDEEQWNHWLDEENGIGYVRIANFQRNTAEDVEDILNGLDAAGLRGLILDVRGNPGGLLDSAWEISALFLEDGENVVSTKGRNRSENQRLDARVDGPFSDLPIIVLADESSASASEIVAGAIRDNHHGLVVGARTFGKFSVQNLIPLGRSNAKLKITTARYYLPSGVSLHRESTSDKWGVEPDVPVRLVRWERANLWKMRREADLLGPPKPERDEDESTEKAADSDKEDQGAEKSATAEPDADAKSEDAAAGEGDTKTAAADESKEDELAELVQPDENNRPLEDPQLDTALLLMRVKLLGEQHPTLATANAEIPETARNP
ncbi:MAG: PDZ domain-containing protein [Phycisphaerales bacterium]|nr:MAG: PDZ domain-containing protein [Phycisphaerales bacterium]